MLEEQPFQEQLEAVKGIGFSPVNRDKDKDKDKGNT